MEVKFGVKEPVFVLFNEKWERGQVVSSFVDNGLVYHTIDLTDKKFHNPRTFVKLLDSSSDLLKDNEMTNCGN